MFNNSYTETTGDDISINTKLRFFSVAIVATLLTLFLLNSMTSF